MPLSPVLPILLPVMPLSPVLPFLLLAPSLLRLLAGLPLHTVCCLAPSILASCCKDSPPLDPNTGGQPLTVASDGTAVVPGSSITPRSAIPSSAEGGASEGMRKVLGGAAEAVLREGLSVLLPKVRAAKGESRATGAVVAATGDLL